MAKIRSNEAWQELFAEYEAGQESARDFCARHGLRLVYFYRRSLELRGCSASRRGREGKPGAPPAAFVPQMKLASSEKFMLFRVSIDSCVVIARRPRPPAVGYRDNR